MEVKKNMKDRVVTLRSIRIVGRTPIIIPPSSNGTVIARPAREKFLRILFDNYDKPCVVAVSDIKFVD